MWAIAELAADSSVRLRSGGTFPCGDLTLEYGFTDVDGRIPACVGGELQPDVQAN